MASLSTTGPVSFADFRAQLINLAQVASLTSQQSTGTDLSLTGTLTASVASVVGPLTVGTVQRAQTTNTAFGEWIQLQNTSPMPIASYTIYDSNKTMLSWSLLGSQDSSTWVFLHNITLTTANQSATTYNVAQGSYLYFRVVAQNQSVSNNTYACIDVLSFNSGVASLYTPTQVSVSVAGEWLQLQSTTTSMPISSYTLNVVGTNTSPQSWKLLGSLDGNSWLLLHDITVSSALTAGVTYNVSQGTYNYFRLIFTALFPNSNPRTGVNQLSFNSGPIGSTGSSVPPQMTSNSSVGYVASASSDYGGSFPAWMAFDMNTNNIWSSSGTYTGSTGIYAGSVVTNYNSSTTTTTGVLPPAMASNSSGSYSASASSTFSTNSAYKAFDRVGGSLWSSAALYSGTTYNGSQSTNRGC